MAARHTLEVHFSFKQQGRANKDWVIMTLGLGREFVGQVHMDVANSASLAYWKNDPPVVAITEEGLRQLMANWFLAYTDPLTSVLAATDAQQRISKVAKALLKLQARGYAGAALELLPYSGVLKDSLAGEAS